MHEDCSVRRLPTKPQVAAGAPWRLIRASALLAYGAVVVCAFVAPHIALACVWGALIPAVPILLVLAPAAWRNVCPIATLGQLPGRGQHRGAGSLPPRLRAAAPRLGLGLFLALVPLRHVLLDRNGPVLGILLIFLAAAAFAGGTRYVGLSGWCATCCPLLQVERAYGHAPLLTIENSRCRPCVGCVAGCYTMTPTSANMRDTASDRLRDRPERWLIAAVLPWLTAGFFTSPDLSEVSVGAAVHVYLTLVAYLAAGCACFLFLAGVLRINLYLLVVMHHLVALNLFYSFAAPVLARTLSLSHTPAAVLLRIAVGILSVAWLVQARWNRCAWLAKKRGRRPIPIVAG